MQLKNIQYILTINKFNLSASKFRNAILKQYSKLDLGFIHDFRLTCPIIVVFRLTLISRKRILIPDKKF